MREQARKIPQVTRDTTPAVDAFEHFQPDGNIVPHAWYRHITFSNGKPDLLAILILADLVYWYRPVREEDEKTGAVVIRKKFAADKLQQTYERLAERLGHTKLQVKRAIDRLRARGLVTAEFRSLKLPNLPPLANVLYLEPCADRILVISSHVDFEVKRGLRQRRTAHYSEVETYTETTTENSGETEPANGAMPADAGEAADAPHEWGAEAIPKRRPRLNVPKALHAYYCRRPCAADIRLIWRDIKVWRAQGRETTQEQLEQAAEDAHEYLAQHPETYAGGVPIGLRVYQRALADLVIGCGVASVESKCEMASR